jgi:hypothetical protein
MPRPEALPQKHQDDTRKIIRFFKRLKSILKNILTNPVNIIPGRFHEMIVHSWSGIETLLEENISSPTPPPMDSIRESGLTSYHLDLKLEIFEHRYAELLDHGQQILWFTTYSTLYPNVEPNQNIEPNSRQIERPPELARNPGDRNNSFWATLRKRLKGCLKAAKVILGSLLKEHNWYTEPIKEFIEAVIGSLEIADDFFEWKQASE